MKYYTQENGRYKEWSRSIVDIFRSEDDIKERIIHNREDYGNNIVSSRYEYTFSDTFFNFLFFEAIPESINKSIKQMLDVYYFDCLPSDERKARERNSFNSLLHQFNNFNSNCPVFEIWRKLSDMMNPDEYKSFEHLTNKFASLAEKIDFYKNLANNIPSNPTHMQYQWIGKPIPKKDPTESIDSITSYNDFIKQKAVTMETFEGAKIINNDKGKPYADGDPRFDNNFLEKYGILLDLSNIPVEEKAIIEKHIKNQEFKSERGKKYTIENKVYEIFSCKRKSDNTVHYVYVETSSNSE